MTECFAITLVLATLAHDMTELHGRWKAVTTLAEGSDVYNEAIECFEWEFQFDGKTGKFSEVTTVSWDENGTEHRLRTGFPFSYRLYLGKRPKAIDVIIHEPNEPWKVERLKGIYSISGDELTLCYDDAVRPTQFTFFGPMSRSGFFKLKRQK